MSDFIHKPVMVAETLAALRPRPGGRYVDGTVGGGGHAAAILAASSPSGWLCGLDRDGDALEAAAERLREFAGRFELHRANFAGMADWVEPGSCDGVFLDLGVSSPQIDRAGRGFSFQRDGPLDMRMDDRQVLTASDLVNGADAAELARIFFEYGGEGQSRRLAAAIVRERMSGRIEGTARLAAVIERVSPRFGRKTHPATKVFQALRIAVNDEIESLRLGLAAAVQALKPGGRLAVISFHSLEDRAVKRFGRERSLDYIVPGEVDAPELRQPAKPVVQWAGRKPVEPVEAEVEDNPRSRSARLRVMEKI